MPQYGEITNQVFRVLTTDNTLQFVYNHPIKEECKVFGDDGKYDVIHNCLDEIHMDYLIGQLQGAIPRIESRATASAKVYDSDVHYLINTFLFICMTIYYVYISKKARRKMQDLDPFCNTQFSNLPGYKTYFTIVEADVEPLTSTPTRNLPSYIGRNRPTLPLLHSNPLPFTINTPEKLLGTGGFGSKVIEGLYREKNKCAIKVIENKTSAGREYDITLLAKSPNVIHMFCIERFKNRTYICMELALDDLKELFKQGNDNMSKFGLSSREICKQLVEGVKVVHESKVAHGDLTPKNILATLTNNSQPIIKIADFSLSSSSVDLLELTDYKTRIDGEFNNWYAPEVFESDKFELEDYMKADIYSLAHMIVYIISEGHFVDSIDFLRYARQLMCQLSRHNEPVTYQELLLLRCMDLVLAMTARDSKKYRPSIQSVANYPVLWDEEQSCGFMVAVSEYLKTSERLNNKPNNTHDKKKSTNTGFKPRSKKWKPKANKSEDMETASMSLEEVPDDQKSSFYLRCAIERHRHRICRGLDWTKLLPHDLMASIPKFVKYNEGCPISLIRFSRNLHSHFSTNKSMQAIVGPSNDHFERFMSTYYPLALPLVYKEVQDHREYFNKAGQYYNPDERIDLYRPGMLGTEDELPENEKVGGVDSRIVKLVESLRVSDRDGGYNTS